MKKIFLLAIIAIFAFSNIKAQGISFGIRAIPTFNWISTTESVDSFNYTNEGTKMGIGFGPSLRYKFSDNFNVDVSGIFTWQKFGIDVVNDNITNSVMTDMNESFKVQFLQVPLNLNGQFDVADDFQALLNFGVGAGIKLSSERLITEVPDQNRISTTYEPADNILTFIDFYLTAGAGVVYNLEDNLHLSLTVQYNSGIVDGWIDGNNDNVFSEINELSIKHQNIALSLGFYIDL